MAQLNKMMIQGIRSFGPDDNDRQLVHFFSPLTLILGQNGCGKTTIIESLKYAITGELPPGGKQGHSFVYDPKLARQTEVLGKVQLKLTDVKGQELAVTRCVQVTQKKTNMQFKTLDTSISRKGPDGKPVQTSGRCIDIDIEMSTSMGVSKSVINNVILCHQEESLWPLDEAKKLKERFDTIFDTVRHNKCLIQIHEMRKNIKNELTILKTSLGHLLDKKQAATRMKETISDTERSINVAQDQVDKCQERCSPMQERLDEIVEQSSDIIKHLGKVENLRTEIKNLKRQQEELKQNIPKLFEGSIDDLTDTINNFQSEVREKEGESRDLRVRIETTKREEEKLNAEVSRKQKIIGKLESLQQSNKREIQSRNRLLEKLQKDLNVQGSSISPQETNVRSVMEKVDQKIREKDDAVVQLHSDLDEAVQHHENRLVSLRETRTKKREEVRMKEQQIDDKISSKNKIQSDIKEVERAASRLAQVEKDLSDVKANLDTVSGEINVDDMKEDIKRFDDDEQRVNQELEKVYKEVEELQRHSEKHTRLTMKQTELGNKEAELNRLRNKTADTLKHLLGSVPDVGLKRRFEECFEQIGQDINTKNNQLRAQQNEISKIEVNRRHKKEQVDAKEKEAKEDEEKIYGHCEDRDLEDVIRDLDDKIQEMRNMKGMLASQEVLYQKYVQKLQEREPCCPLCHRNFDRAEEATTLIDELRGEVRTVPVRLRSNNEKLERSVQQYDMLLQLRSTNDRLKTAKETVIPKLKKELRDVENQLKQARERAEELQTELLTPQTDEGMAKSVQSDVFVLDKCQSEVKICKTEISKLQAELPPTVSTRSLDEVMKIQADLRKEVADLRQSIRSSKDTLETHTNKIQKLHARKNALVEEQLKIQGGTQQLQQMRENLAELEVQIGDLEEQVQLLKSDVIVVNKDCDDACRTLDEVKTNNRAQIKKEEDAVNELKNKYKDIIKYNRSIDEYERHGTSAELTTTQQALCDVERDREQLKKRHTELSERNDRLKSEISGQELHRRELDDNLKLMVKQKEEGKLTTEMTALTKKHGALKQTYLEMEKEKKTLESNIQTIMKESQQAQGRVEEMKKRLVSLRKEMAEEMYEDADKKYSNALREKMVKEIVDSDLAKYHKAMEWTMTQFHQERMKVINEIIHDLWRTIYRGNDIDYIKIEAKAPDTTAETAKRRSYDYRVVQVKNDIEIDMRGRCSAGQKVLACLIIRMALAETLSSQCGILALDEPTTNLDRENIESLADALAQIVNTRMVNKGFQLIVITHDEEFVNHMKQGGQLSYYHIVTRNEQGKSRIQKHVVQ